MSTGYNVFNGAEDEGVGSVALQLAESKTLKIRLSVLKDDPNYTPDAKNYFVYFDGIKQMHCIIADSENGYILRYKTTTIGTFKVGKDGKFQTEEVFGNVVIAKRK